MKSSPDTSRSSQANTVFSTCIFDIETDGLLDTMTRLHCLVILDPDSGEMVSCHTPDEVAAGIELLENAETVIGHNILSFDIPALRKLFPGRYTPRKDQAVLDTLICTRLIYPDIKNTDFAMSRTPHASALPFRLYGSHSLEAWGFRLGVYKDTFGKTTNWQEWSREMQEYCEQDVRVTERLYRMVVAKDYSERAVRLEHEFRSIIDRQEAFGFCFDRERAVELYGALQEKRVRIKEELQAIFPPVDKGCLFVPKRDNKTKGYKKDIPVWKPNIIPFNPASRQQIAERLMEKYNWAPTEFTDKGTPKIDEEVLSGLGFPECGPLSEYLLLEKRLGQLSDGAQAWLRSIDEDGRIHGQVNTNGAVTGRCTHHHPNIAQVPAVGAPYGEECRGLFGPPKGYYQLGCDASGLELRCLAHYLTRYDGGAYQEVILHGDIHTTNMKAAGLTERSVAKRFIYAYLYGAGDVLIGSLIDPSLEDDTAKAALGKKIKKRFLSQTPALAQLIDDVQRAVKTRNYLIGMDGRLLPVRSEHSALNTLLQSAGAVVMKLATVLLWRSFEQEQGWAFGKEVAQMAHIHDEFQLAVRNDINKEVVGEIAVRSIRAAGEELGFRCPLDGEYKVGRNWAETH